MVEFYQGTELNVQLERVFKEAKKKLLLISPFIKLHDRLKDILQAKAKEDKLPRGNPALGCEGGPICGGEGECVFEWGV